MESQLSVGKKGRQKKTERQGKRETTREGGKRGITTGTRFYGALRVKGKNGK